MDKKLEVRERMKRRYAFKNYPDEFSYRCKCIVVFQNLDGVDAILFGLYVYEHDEKNPPPNQRSVYVSYLDSVHYMRPRHMRTFIYHEILISYLDYVRRRGFARAHIWACPPLKGDDYILYAKPEDQKTPKDDRLRQWYLDMLVECQKRGVVGKLTNMYDMYFTDPKNDATVVPYMDGDYFPAEAENIIKDIEEGKAGKKKDTQGKKKKNDKAKQKKKSGRGGTRSTGLDEEALKASGIVPAGKDQKSLEEGGRDYVMVKLGETISGMKESFIVAHLAWDGATEEEMAVPKAIQEHREKHGVVVKWKAKEDKKGGSPAKSAEGTKKSEENLENGSQANEAASTPAEESASAPEDKKDGSPAKPAEGTEAPAPMNVDGDEKPETQAVEQKDGSPAKPAEGTEAPAPMDVDEDEKPETQAEEQKDAAAPAAAPDAGAPPPVVAPGSEASPAEAPEAAPAPEGAPSPEAASEAAPEGAPSPAAAPEDAPSPAAASEAAPGAAPVAEPESVEKGKQPASVLSMEERSGKFAAMQKKRGRDGASDSEDGKDERKEEAVPTSTYVADEKGRKVKVIDDDEEEMDCEFLNNRQAFLNLCQGNHYQFDFLRRAKHSSMMVLWHLHNRDAPKFVTQCTTCSREILAGYRFHCPTCADFDQCQECVRNPNTPRHPHQLKPIPVATGQQTELTDSQRKERQRSIQLHMTLLLHAATCTSTKCPSANCTKMKGLLKHGAQCQQKATGGCNVCKRIWALLQIHARQCKAASCPVPNCMAIRERVRQLKKQQQAMDDRRRQEMNRIYRGAR